MRCGWSGKVSWKILLVGVKDRRNGDITGEWSLTFLTGDGKMRVANSNIVLISRLVPEVKP
ncbi:hypothetical protein GCM10027580_19120 [Corynebacterium faecale]